MKKVSIVILLLVGFLTMYGCTTVTPVFANETSATIVRDEFEILGRVVVKLDNIVSLGEVGLRNLINEKAQELYGSRVDDVIDITVSVVQTSFVLFQDTKTVAEGVAVQWTQFRKD